MGEAEAVVTKASADCRECWSWLRPSELSSTEPRPLCSSTKEEQGIAGQVPSAQATAWAGASLGAVSGQHLGSKGHLGLVLGGASGWHATAPTLWCHTVRSQVLVVPLLS